MWLENCMYHVYDYIANHCSYGKDNILITYTCGHLTYSPGYPRMHYGLASYEWLQPFLIANFAWLQPRAIIQYTRLDGQITFILLST